MLLIQFLTTYFRPSYYIFNWHFPNTYSSTPPIGTKKYFLYLFVNLLLYTNGRKIAIELPLFKKVQYLMKIVESELNVFSNKIMKNASKISISLGDRNAPKTSSTGKKLIRLSSMLCEMK